MQGRYLPVSSIASSMSHVPSAADSESYQKLPFSLPSPPPSVRGRPVPLLPLRAFMSSREGVSRLIGEFDQGSFHASVNGDMGSCGVDRNLAQIMCELDRDSAEP